MVGPPLAAVRALAFVSATLGGLQILTLALSALQIPVVAPVAAAIVAVSVTAAAWFAQRFPGSDSPGRSGWSAVGVVSAVWLLLLVVAWQRPVYDWDGLYYHLPAIHGWLEAGRIAWIHDSPDVPFVNGYPMGVELMGFLTTKLTGSMRLVDAGNLWFWPMGFLGVVLAASSLGARSNWAWWAGPVLLSSPMFLAESISAYVDPAFACAGMGVFGVLPWALRFPGSAAWSALLGLQFGLLVATKGLGVPFVVVAALVWIAFRFVGRVSVRSSLAHFGGVAAVAFAIAGFWFVRNVVEVGNPIHPIRLATFGHVWFDGYDHAAATLLNLPPWLADLPEPLRTLRAWTQPEAPIRDAGAVGGLGFLWLLGGVPAGLLLWTRTRSRTLTVLTILALLFLLAQPATWWARFTLWLLGLGGAWLVTALGSVSRRVAVPLGLAFCVVAGVEATILLRAELARGREDGQYVSSADYYFRGVQELVPEVFASPHLARSDWSRLGVLFGGVLAQEPTRTIDWVQRYPEPEQIAALIDAGVDWFVWDVIAAGEPPIPLAEVALERRRFERGTDTVWEFVRVR